MMSRARISDGRAPSNPIKGRRPFVRRIALIFATLVLAACNAEKRAALGRVDDARAHGDKVGEAAGWRAACAADPADTEVCANASRTESAVLEDALARAQPACALS